jgi:RNA polymerase sigma-70 factor (ECF subfamily)
VTSHAESDDRVLDLRSISADETSVSVPVSDDDERAKARDSGISAKPHAPDSFTAVYEKYADFVWLSLQRLGVRKSDRQDLCHDVFVVAYRKLPAYTERAAVRRWLFAIALRLASNYRRKAYLRFEHPIDSLEADPSAIPEFAWPEAAVARREAFDHAEAILADMQPLQRVVFVMFEIEGFSCDAIATELGVPLGTVYSRLHTARKLFQGEARRWARESKGNAR